jgi:hypothetical protein
MASIARSMPIAGVPVAGFVTALHMCQQPTNRGDIEQITAAAGNHARSESARTKKGARQVYG